jgi:hypothetical protein
MFCGFRPSVLKGLRGGAAFVPLGGSLALGMLTRPVAGRDVIPVYRFQTGRESLIGSTLPK